MIAYQRPVIFHIPTFLKQYEEFWGNPEACSFTWLGLLFIMISHSALFCLRGDEEVPGNLGGAMQVSDAFRRRAAQCLSLDDYTAPGKYKVETLLLYFGTEYLRQNDANLGTSVLMSAIVRLAMHMGYHRDRKHFKDISIFEGEMRRRLWTLLAEVDELVSFQFGLPPNIQPQYFDTEPPRNLFDEDFDESTTELPPSRPESERTPTLYVRVKARIITIFGEILATTNSREVKPYEHVLVLDKRLESAHNSFPPSLGMRSFSQSIIDPIELIMLRYSLELLYQKARCVLHRKFLGVARINNRYAYSRWTCIDAATKTLQHQYDIHVEIQPGGRLAKDRWFVSSLSIHDFLLADMVLCLELSYVLHLSQKSPDVRQAEPLDSRLTVVPKEQLLDILRTSRSIWQTTRRESKEANRAFRFLSRMIATSTGAPPDAYDTSSGESPDSGPSSGAGPNSSVDSVGAVSLRDPQRFRLPSLPTPSSAFPQLVPQLPVSNAGDVIGSGGLEGADWGFGVAVGNGADLGPAVEGAMGTDLEGEWGGLGSQTAWVSQSFVLGSQFRYHMAAY